MSNLELAIAYYIEFTDRQNKYVIFFLGKKSTVVQLRKSAKFTKTAKHLT